MWTSREFQFFQPPEFKLNVKSMGLNPRNSKHQYQQVLSRKIQEELRLFLLQDSNNEIGFTLSELSCRLKTTQTQVALSATPQNAAISRRLLMSFRSRSMVEGTVMIFTYSAMVS